MVLNQTEDLIAQVLKENEMNVTVRDFAAEPEYTMAVSDRLNEELRIALAVREVSQLNFELLYQLVRAMSNTLILTQDQVALVKSLHVQRADGQEINLSASVISLLSRMPADLLQPDRKSGPALEKGQIRFFILMITHAFRLLIIMQSVDKNCLDSDENPSQKTSLH